MSTRQELFHAKRLGNHVHWTHIFIFLRGYFINAWNRTVLTLNYVFLNKWWWDGKRWCENVKKKYYWVLSKQYEVFSICIETEAVFTKIKISDELSVNYKNPCQLTMSTAMSIICACMCVRNLGSNISSTESNVNTHFGKTWIAINILTTISETDFSDDYSCYVLCVL